MQSLRQLAITPQHRARLAVVYVRTARMPTSPADHACLTAQRDQAVHARAWGWPDSAIQVIEDIGWSGASAEGRPAWQRLLRLVSQGQVGMILATDASRLSRSRTDAITILDLCERTKTLLVFDGVVCRPDPPDALLPVLSAEVR